MPAIESDFVYLNKQKQQYVALENNEKHLLYGAALRPDFPIYRYDENGEYYIEFSKKAIEKLCRKFFQDDFQSNWTKQHMDNAEGLTVVESWIKTDMSKDKSLALGLDENLPIGTWFIGAYCDSNDIWEMVKNGTFKGFSVEAMVSLNELNFKKEEKMDNEKFWDKMKNILLEALTETQTTTTTTVEEPSNVEPTEQTLEEPSNVEPIEEPTEEVIETVEETVEEPKEEAVNQEIDIVADAKVVETVNEEPKEDVDNKLNEQIGSLNAQIEALKAEIEALKAENSKLAIQPSTKPTSTNGGTDNNAFRNWREYVRNHS